MSLAPETDVPTGTTPEPLWMTSRPVVGDVQMQWEDLTEAEQRNAIAQHNRIYGIET